MKILIGCNTLTEVKSIAYTNHMQMWFNLGKWVKPEDKIVFHCPRRMSIDRMRNESAKMALQYECDYLFFYDDDVVLPIDALQSLLETHKKYPAALVIGGLTYVRGIPYNPMIFRYVKQGENNVYSMICYTDFKDNVDEHGVVVCDALGFSCCLIDTTALKMLNPPYFVTGPENTEDVYFCHKLNTEAYNDSEFDELQQRIIMDTKVKTGHILDHYAITDENREHFIELDTNLYGKFDASKRKDRDDSYRDGILERFRSPEAVYEG